MAVWLYDRSTLHAPRTLQRVRLNVVVPGQGGAQPWLFESPEGSSQWLTVQGGAIRIKASYASGPPFWNTAIPVTEGASHPRLAREPMGRLWLTFEADGSTWYTTSGDAANSFEAPTMAIPGGTKPTLAGGLDGLMVIAARVDGVLKARRQYAGDAALGDLFTLQLWNGSALVDLAVEDDTFHLMQAWEPSARWWLHATLAGETDTARLWSGDHAATWVRANE